MEAWSCCRFQLQSCEGYTVNILSCVGDFNDGIVVISQAEAKLAAKRQARAEARQIRLKELERQQKEASTNDDDATRDSFQSDFDTCMCASMDDQ